jgi:glycosyltransferase involved in cell wall biosynthesis
VSNNPVVSVLLPFAGSCSRLDCAIKSILEQDYDDLELVLVDNGATSAAKAIATAFADSDSRVRILNEPQTGIAKALNTGIRNCSGKYIARMDSDDLALPGRIYDQVNFMESHPQVGLVSGLVIFSGDPDYASGFSAYVDQLNRIRFTEEIHRYRFLESPFAHPSVLFRRSLTETFGAYSEDPSIPEDYELWLRWMDAGVIMHKLPRPVLDWHDSPGRLSRTSAAYSRDAFDRVRMKYLVAWMKKNHGNRHVWTWGAGKLARRKSALLQSEGIPVTGFIDITHQTISGNLPVIHFHHLPPPGEVFIISMVSNRGKPFEIEAFLLDRGYREGRDFVLCG